MKLIEPYEPTFDLGDAHVVVIRQDAARAAHGIVLCESG